MMLQGKKILLGITGGIAAYKCASLVRFLIKEGSEVKVVMTKSATEFVTPQTLAVLSKNEVIIDFFDASFNWNNHVSLAEWADIVLIAPCTANSLSKMANGICDNVLLAIYLSAKCKVFIAPAMDLDMYRHPAVRQNIQTLESNGNVIIPAESGELASGLVGEGRMAEPENIIIFLQEYMKQGLIFAGKKVLINAGPTYEAIDPVRFVGNRSSGKMGVAIADMFAAAGAQVVLVLGPTNVRPQHRSVNVVSVESANEMYDATIANYALSDIVICSAAVADYKPKVIAESKIKKNADELHIELTKTKDILAELGRSKKAQFLVGFALETENVIEYAKKKLVEKNLDMVVANSALESGSGFGVDTNKITIIDKHNKITTFELKSKLEVAQDILNYISVFYK